MPMIRADGVCTDQSIRRIVAIKILNHNQASPTPISTPRRNPRASPAALQVDFMRPSGSRATCFHIRLEAGGLTFRWMRSVARPQSTGLHRGPS